MMLAVGEKAPLFEVPGTDGSIDLAAAVARGPVVLYFFPRAFTPGCAVEAVEFNQALPEFEELGVQIIGTSVDPPERLSRFRDKHELLFPLASDSDRRLGNAYGTLKSEQGSHARNTFIIGADGIIAAAYKKVSAKGHAAQVLTDGRRLREEARI